MTREHLELIGLLVTHVPSVRQYRIDYVYTTMVNGKLDGTAVQKGFDWRLHIPFKDIVTSLSDAYAPVLEKRWTHRFLGTEQVFMSLHPDCGPGRAGLAGKWVLTCER